MTVRGQFGDRAGGRVKAFTAIARIGLVQWQFDFAHEPVCLGQDFGDLLIVADIILVQQATNYLSRHYGIGSAIWGRIRRLIAATSDLLSNLAGKVSEETSQQRFLKTDSGY